MGFTNVFAAGDVTDVAEEKNATAACCAGTTVARNICRLERGKPPVVQGQSGSKLSGSLKNILLHVGDKTGKFTHK